MGEQLQANLENIPLSHDFALQIEDIVKTAKMPYIDAVAHWCEINGKEIVVGADLVKKTPVIKDKIRAEAEDLNLLPKGAKLPI